MTFYKLLNKKAHTRTLVDHPSIGFKWILIHGPFPLIEKGYRL